MTVPEAWIAKAWHMAKQAPSLATVLALGGAYGLIAYVYDESAKADELQALQSQVETLTENQTALTDDVKAGRIEGLEGQIFEARVAQCRAETDELKELYSRRVTNLQSQYRDLTGYEMNIPQCSEL